MGTDIHAYLECRSKENPDKWLSLGLYTYEFTEDRYCMKSLYSGKRDYEMFDKLAGGRSGFSTDYFAPLRGIPDDLSPQVAEIWENQKEYVHSETWYDVRELHLLEQTPMALVLDDFDANYDEDNSFEDNPKRNVLTSFVEEIDYILEQYFIFNPDVGEARVVMWFDS